MMVYKLSAIQSHSLQIKSLTKIKDIVYFRSHAIA